jgi:hypothetical protein
MPHELIAINKKKAICQYKNQFRCFLTDSIVKNNISTFFTESSHRGLRGMGYGIHQLTQRERGGNASIRRKAGIGDV